MVNRICEDTAGYELWSTSGSAEGMPNSAQGVPGGCSGTTEQLFRVRVRVRVRVGGGMRYLRTEKLRSFHLRPFIVFTIAKRTHYKAEKETTCSVNVLKVRVRVRVRVEDISIDTQGTSPQRVRMVNERRE